MNTLFAKQSSSTAYKACKALHFEFKAIVWKDNEKHTAKSFISRVKIYKYICGPVSVGFAKMFSLLTRSSSSAFKLWKMWWRPAALRVVAWRHETLSPIWLWFSSTLDSDQLCTTPSRHTVMNLRSIVAAWPRISHLFFKPKMRETPETVLAFQLGIVARWKKCWISFFSFVRRLWNSGLRFFDEFSNVPQLQEQRSLCDPYFHEQYSKALGLCASDLFLASWKFHDIFQFPNCLWRKYDGTFKLKFPK